MSVDRRGSSSDPNLNLDDYPVSIHDPGTPLAGDEKWYCWTAGDLKGRFRVRDVDGDIERIYPGKLGR